MKKVFSISRTMPRWIILLIDLVITTSSFTLSYFILKQFEFAEILRGHFFIYTGLFFLVSLCIFYCMRIHTGLIRHSNFQDMLRILCAVAVVSLAYPVFVQLIVVNRLHIHSLSISWVLLLNFFISTSLLIMLRIGVKEFYYYIKQGTSATKQRALIYGSDFNAILIKQAIEAGNTNKFNVVGFLETDSSNTQLMLRE